MGVLEDGSLVIDPNVTDSGLEVQLEEWQEVFPRLPLGDVVAHAARSAGWANFLLPLVLAAKERGASIEQAIAAMNVPVGELRQVAYPSSEPVRAFDAELILVVFELLWLAEDCANLQY